MQFICMYMSSTAEANFGTYFPVNHCRPHLESTTVILVVLNAIVLSVEYQVEGESIGKRLMQGQEHLRSMSVCVPPC